MPKSRRVRIDRSETDSDRKQAHPARARVDRVNLRYNSDIRRASPNPPHRCALEEAPALRSVAGLRAGGPKVLCAASSKAATDHLLSVYES